MSGERPKHSPAPALPGCDGDTVTASPHSRTSSHIKTAFTGRRRIGPPEVDTICRVVSEEMEVHRLDQMIFGGAQGSDTAALIAAGRICETLPVEERPAIIVVLPGRLPDQPAEARSAIVEYADEIDQLKLPVRFPLSYRKRNRAMVSMADRVVAFWDGRESGGTYITIEMAREKGCDLRVVRIDHPYEPVR